ncbi:hypothetical protein [Butyrivibrio sp. MC2021]|uniref:hypothetical protein n=1 Tax=Butyrivibrio sp. MC2021 TaxID=1408306 RepID=UPI0006852DB4|nr:hypothetical protein [Butyrivibrio sp. MC2021]
MGNSESINRKYKDRLFNYIFGREENREWTLSLYNAVNGSNYTDPDLIEFNTLSDVLFMGMKNDTSFLVFDIMSVYEHQSSLNLNMPLRMLQYVGDLYSGYIAKNKLNKYGTGRIMLPSDFVIKDFLVKHRQEVEGMLDTEYKEAEVMELFKEDGRKEGIAQGIEQSISMMLSRGKTPEEIVDFCGYPLEMVLKVQEGLGKVN